MIIVVLIIMDKNKIFLSAEWVNLIHVSYKVNPNLLLQNVPPNLELDTIGGEAVITLVAFDFKNTKVKGVPVPAYGNFSEINLRYNVKDKQDNFKGVVFIKELIPRSAIAFAANMLYNEKYETASIKSVNEELPETFKISYSLKMDKSNYNLTAILKKRTSTPPEDSVEHRIKQRDAGFGKTRDGKTLIYRVDHSLWELYPLVDFRHNIDFRKVFGDEWKFLNEEKEFNVMVAKGSPVNVYEWEVYSTY